MKYLGNFRGYQCFECDYWRWVQEERSPEKIYIINGYMVKNGVIIGEYRDNRVISSDLVGRRFDLNCMSLKEEKEEKKEEDFNWLSSVEEILMGNSWVDEILKSVYE